MSVGIRGGEGRKTGAPADDLPAELVKFRFDLPPSLPLPLAHLYSQMDTTPREGHGYAYFLFEALLKLTASTAAAAYLEVVERGGAPEDGAVDAALANLAQPTTGKWVALLRSVAAYFAQAEEQQQHPLSNLEDELQAKLKSPGLVALHNAMHAALGDPTAKTTCSVMELFETATEYRNKKIGHGTVLPARFCRDMLSLFVAAANEVLAPDKNHLLGPPGTRLLCLKKISLTDDELIRVDVRELKGTVPSRLEPWKVKKSDGMRLVQGHVAILWPDRKMPLSLAPFLSFHQKRPNADIYFLNGGLGRPRVSYLSYLLDGTELDAGRTSTSERLARLVRGGRRRPDAAPAHDEAPAPSEREPKTSPAMTDTVSAADDTVLLSSKERATPNPNDSVLGSPSASGIASGATAEPPPKTGLAEYEILGRLGRGGMGVVQLAWQESLARWVALKTLPLKAPRRRRNSDSSGGAVNTPATNPSSLSAAHDRRALKQFRREMQHLARCQHPNIIKVLQEITTPDRQICYALEYVAGCNAKQAWHEVCKRAKATGHVAELDGSLWTTAVCEASRDQLRRVKKRARGGQASAEQSLTPAAPRDASARTPAPSAVRRTPAVRHAAAESEHWPPEPELLDEGPEPGGYVRRVAMLGRDVARALQVVHERRIVHRDVKPENLMLTSDGLRVVLMDFGVAKKFDQKTKTNSLRGTLPYAAPEQLDLGRARIGPQADVHGLGVVLWELLARQPLFAEAEGDEDKLIDLLKYQDAPLLRTIDPSIHPDLEAIVDRAVKRSVKDRVQTAGQLADYLDRYLDDKEIEIRERPWPEKLRDWAGENKALVGSVLAGLAAVVLVTVAAFAFIVNALHNETVARNDAVDQRALAEKDRTQAEADRKEADKQRKLADQQKEFAQQQEKLAQASGKEALKQAGIAKGALAGAKEERDKAVELQRGAQRNLYVANIRLADEAKRQRDLGRTWDLLNSPGSLGDGSSLAAMRGWEWSYLSGVCRQSVIHAIPQQSSVSTVGWSRDGQLLATGDADGQLAVWNSETGQMDSRWASRKSSGIDFDVDFTGGAGNKLLIGAVKPEAPDKSAVPQKGDEVVAVADAAGKMQPTAPLDIKGIASLLKGNIGTTVAVEVVPAAGGPHKTYTLVRRRAAPEIHNTSVRNVSFSPDGKFLASVDDSGTLKLWDLNDPGSSTVSRSILTDRATIYCAAFSSKVGMFATGADDNNVRLYNISTDKTQVLKGHEAAVLQVVFSPDGRHLASAGSDGTVRIWNTDTFEQENSVTVADKGNACGVAYHPSGRILATVDYQGVSVWDLDKKQRIRRIDASLNDVVCAFSADGRRVACGGLDGSITFVDLIEGRVASKLRAHSGTIQEIAYSPDGRFLASAGSDKTAKVWNIAPEAERLWNIAGGQQAVDVGGRTVDGFVSGNSRLRVDFTPDQHRLIPLEGVSRVRLWDAATGRWLGGPQGDIDSLQAGGKLTCAVLSPDGALLGLGAQGQALLATADSGLIRFVLPGHQGGVGRIAFSPDGTLLATADGKSSLRIWTVATGKLAVGPLQAVLGDAKALGFSHDGHLLASIFGSNRVELWDVAKGAKVGDLTGQGESRPYTFAFHPDGHTLITGGFTGAIVAWDMTTGQRVRTIGNHGAIVAGVAINRDATRLATCGIDQTVKIWDYNTGDELLALGGHGCSVHSVAFSNDGQRVVSVGEDGGIRLWDAALLTATAPPATWWDAYLHGCIWADAGNWTEALADYDRAVDLGKDHHDIDPHLWHQHGLALTALGRYDEARRDYALALRSLGDDGAIWLSGFVARASAADTNGAEDDYLQALARSRDAIGYSGNGDDLWMNLRPAVQGDPGSWMLDINNLGRQIDPDPQGAAWYLYRARGLAEAVQDGPKNYSLAGLDFNEALKRKADDWRSWFGLGRSLMEVEFYKKLADRKLDNADAAFSKAVELKGDDWQLRCVRAVCRRHEKRFDDALTDLDRAVELAPQALGPRLLRGNLLVDRSNFALAAKDLAAAVDAGAATSVRIDLGFVDLAAGNAADYQKVCQYLLTKYPISENTRAANLVAWVWAMGPHPEPVPPQLISAVRAAATDAKDNDPIQTLGAILYRSGQDLTTARDMLQRSVAMQNDTGELPDWLFLALVEQKLGNKEQAQKWHDKVVAWLAAKPANALPDEKVTNQDRMNLRLRVEATALSAEYLSLTGGAPAPQTDAPASK